jgi:hypothetical protein
MLTAAIVDSQVANRKQVWLTASKPTFSIHCKHLKSTCLIDQERKFPVAWLSHSQVSTSLSRQTHQCLGSRKASHPHDRRHTGQELCLAVNLQGLYKSTGLQLTVCQFRLSFHVVGKGVCLVMLWQNPARRDKRRNHIALVRQTCSGPPGNLHGHVGIPFPKEKMMRYY